jgi:hypothetical protein
VNIDDRLRAVKLAEIDCEQHATAARTAWKTLNATAKESATPWRIVTVGAIAGFFMGRSGGSNVAAPSVGAKLFGSVANMLITTLGASATAGAAAASAADAAAVATADAVAVGSTAPEARQEAAAAVADAESAHEAAADARLHEDA